MSKPLDKNIHYLNTEKKKTIIRICAITFIIHSFTQFLFG